MIVNLKVPIGLYGKVYGPGPVEINDNLKDGDLLASMLEQRHKQIMDDREKMTDDERKEKLRNLSMRAAAGDDDALKQLQDMTNPVKIKAEAARQAVVTVPHQLVNPGGVDTSPEKTQTPSDTSDDDDDDDDPSEGGDGK